MKKVKKNISDNYNITLHYNNMKQQFYTENSLKFYTRSETKRYWFTLIKKILQFCFKSLYFFRYLNFVQTIF